MYAEPKHWSWWVWWLGLGEEFGEFSTICYSLVELSLGGLILITYSAGAGVFLKLSRLFVKINRWVLVRMSLNCKLSGFNGRLSTCSKLKEAKEPLHGPISVRKWRRRLLLFCLLVFVALGSFGFLWSFNHGTLWGKDKAPNPCKEKLKSCYNIFNVSKNQLHALTSPLSESDQVPCL